MLWVDRKFCSRAKLKLSFEAFTVIPTDFAELAVEAVLGWT